MAANRIELEQVAELVEGAAEICRDAGVAFVGGETAELPGIYRDEELDFAGTCVGIVERDGLIDGSQVRAGDVVVGLPSAGVHANGFTLVRRILEEEDYDGDDLLAPTRCYLDDVRRLRPSAHAFAHVTGGGIAGNVARVVPDGLAARIDWDAWERPAVYHWLARHVDEDELRRVFNLGIGYCAIVEGPRRRPGSRAEADAQEEAGKPGPDAGEGGGMIGVLASGEGTNLQALLDAGLPVSAVASNKPGVRALERAQSAGVPSAVFSLEDHAGREDRDRALGLWLGEQGAEVAVLAGYMHLLTTPFLELFPDRIVNVHPSLLPKYPGMHAIEDALAAGETSTGATVHFVDEGVDSGPIIGQVRVAIFESDTVDSVRARIQSVEHWLLPRCVSLCLEGQVFA